MSNYLNINPGIDINNTRFTGTPSQVYLKSNIRWWAAPVNTQNSYGTAQPIIFNDGDLELGAWVKYAVENGVITYNTLQNSSGDSWTTVPQAIGSTTDTTDGDGELTIPHGVTGFTPDWATVSLVGDDANGVDVISVDGTNLVVRIKDAAGADVTATEVTVNWMVAKVV